MPNFSSLARLEVPEKFLWWGGWGVQSHFRVKPNRCVVLCCVGVGVLTIVNLSKNVQTSVFSSGAKEC